MVVWLMLVDQWCCLFCYNYHGKDIVIHKNDYISSSASEPSFSVWMHPSPLMNITHYPLSPNWSNETSLPPTLLCTFIWDTIHNSIEHVDSEEPGWLALPTDLATAILIPNHVNHTIKWTINRISIPIRQGDLFWILFWLWWTRTPINASDSWQAAHCPPLYWKLR